MKLLSSSNAKTIKGEKIGILTGVLYLSPAKKAGGKNLCPFASEGCIMVCLDTSGRGIFEQIQSARLAKTRSFLANPVDFTEQLAKDIEALIRKAERDGMKPAVRLNGTSDIQWELIKGKDGKNLFERFPNVQFYDYTKNPNRALKHAKGGMPKNYFLCFSRSECNEEKALEVLKAGGSVAAVFSTKKGNDLPSEWQGRPIEDGDAHDAIFVHGSGVVIGLRAKGQAKKDTSGFVVHA